MVTAEYRQLSIYIDHFANLYFVCSYIELKKDI